MLRHLPISRPLVVLATSRGVAILAVLLLVTADPHTYIKYPQFDAYVSSCSEKQVNYGGEPELHVRRVIPDIRSRDRTATTSRVHSRAWHKTDTGCVQGDERLDSYECGSVEETATAEAKSLYINEQPHTRPVNVPDYYTMTRGGETALYQYPHFTGPYHTTTDEGSLFPFDQKPQAGWCGDARAGDRVGFLLFDRRDFSVSE